MLHKSVDNTCLLIGSILAYLSLKDPHEDLTEADRVLHEGHMVNFLRGLKLMKYASRFFALAELYLNLIPQPPHSYLFPLPEILQRLFPTLFSTHESIIMSNLRPLFLFTFLASGALRVWAMYTLGHLFTFVVSIRKDHKLITDGPYAYVRHPSYTGFYGLTATSAFLVATSQLTERVIGLRTAIVHTGWLGVLGVIIVASTGVFICHHYFGRQRMENEEEMLEHEFGKEWDLYKRKVPYKIFPFIW